MMDGGTERWSVGQTEGRWDRYIVCGTDRSWTVVQKDKRDGGTKRIGKKGLPVEFMISRVAEWFLEFEK